VIAEVFRLSPRSWLLFRLFLFAALCGLTGNMASAPGVSTELGFGSADALKDIFRILAL